MTELELPAVLAKGDHKRVAHTASDYWHFVYDGFKATDEQYEPEPGEFPAEEDEDLPAPVEVLQRPKRQRDEQATSNDGRTTNAQGTAAGGDDVSSPAAPNA